MTYPQASSQLHQEAWKVYHAISCRFENPTSLYERSTLAFCATANLLHLGLQNTTREGTMRHQVSEKSGIYFKKSYLNKCSFRCIQSIMYLLKMASNQQPAADDLVPVLIYVIIKVRNCESHPSVKKLQLNFSNRQTHRTYNQRSITLRPSSAESSKGKSFIGGRNSHQQYNLSRR